MFGIIFTCRMAGVRITYSSFLLALRCRYARKQMFNFLHHRKVNCFHQIMQKNFVTSNSRFIKNISCVHSHRQTNITCWKKSKNYLWPHYGWYNLVPPMRCLTSVRNYSTVTNVEVDMLTLERYLDSLHEEYQMLTSSDKKKDLADEKGGYKQRLLFLSSLMEIRQAFVQKLKELEELHTFISGIDSSEEEIRFMAEKEKREYKAEIEALKLQILEHLLPKDDIDTKDIVLEISSGAGGQEAMLFSAEVFEMYKRYSVQKGWDLEVLDCTYGDAGGMRKVVASMSGDNVFECMKTESGVHRVQRIPKTESKGRVHTSTISVLILPQPSEIEVEIDPKDLKVESMRAQGPGGQHVNTTDSAVRLTHIPTGIAAESQACRSKRENMLTAMITLRTKIYKKQLEKQESEQQSLRKQQVKSLDRSEKIRTYNFMQDRITDHRIKENLYNVEDFMSGGEALSYLSEKLQIAIKTDTLQTMLDEFKLQEKKKEKGRKKNK